MSVTKRKRNPVVQRDAKPFPFMASDYPVKPWVNPATEARFMTVSFRQDDGSFAAFIAEDESIWATGKTRREAEERVMAVYAERAANPAAEDKEIGRLIDERKNMPTMPWRDWMKKYA